MSAHIANYRQKRPQYQPGSQVQPIKHKILKSHLKIVSRSNDKLMGEKVQPKDYLSISKTINLSSIKNLQGSARKGLKLEVDNRLNKVYSHIIKYRSISLRPTINQSNIDIAKLQKSQQQGYEQFDTIKQQNPPTLSTQLPYQLLRAYVQSIYEDYHIKDPLEVCGKQFQINFKSNPNSLFDKKNRSDKKTERMTVLSTPQKNNLHLSIVNQEKDKLSTKKKILQLKRHFINQLSMTEQTTEKKQSSSKINITKKINLQNEFNNHVTFNFQNKATEQVHQNQIADFNSNHKLAQTKLTTVSNNNYLRSYQSVNLRSSEYQNPTLTNSRVQQFVLQGQNRFNTVQKKISQTFRYCFVCEQPVLQTNIKFHERQCSGLRELLNDQNLNKQKLMFLIQNKIHKVQKQLEYSFHQIQKQNLNQQFAEIKNYTKQWLSKIQTNEDLYSSQAKINSLVENTNVLKTMELINKLKWFVHLKKNFLKIITK